MRTHYSGLPLQRRVVLATVLALAALDRQALRGASPQASDFNADTVRTTIAEVAAIIGREYMDADVAARLSQSIQRRLIEGEYRGIATPDALATRLTADLFRESQDKHLFVTMTRDAPSGSRAPARAAARADGVRRTNAGVQRIEILAGNVGYLNLTAFWRVEEAREVIAHALGSLRRADALIVDVRQNTGGSPDTVALLAGYLFDDAGLPLFDIVPRSGPPEAYATPKPAPAERDGRRPVSVLTSSRTFSAGEGFAFILQERGRAEVVGERTSGAANPGRPYRVNSMFEVTVPNGRVRAAVSGRNWEGTGVIPDVEVAAADALTFAHARALDRLIQKAEGPWRVQLERAREDLDVPPIRR